MAIIIKKYTSNEESIWNAFVKESVNSTFLHSRNFYNHNPSNLIDDFSLLIYDENKLCALLPGIKISREGSIVFHSHLRSTYGGLLINKNCKTENINIYLKSIIYFLKENEFNELIIRPTFSIYNEIACDSILYAMWLNNFKTLQMDIEFAISLNNEPFLNFDSSTKRNIKKALKNNLKVTEDSDLDAYWILLTNNLKSKHNSKPVHTIDEIKNLISNVGDDKIKLFTTLKDSKIIAGILLFVANNKVLHAQYIASDEDFQEFRPLNILIDHIIKWAKINNFSYFNLGMSNEPGQKELNLGLTRFKEGFGARGVLRETYHLNL
jgi:hypothetical protein